jgi:hypothetical protein
MVIYTHFPYLVSDSFFKELENVGVTHIIENIRVHLTYDELSRKYGGESPRHQALKKVAFQMLKEAGEPNPEYEFNYYDVYSPKLRIIIECGNTSADKILEGLFRWNIASEVWVLDYPNENGYAELIKFKKKWSERK